AAETWAVVAGTVTALRYPRAELVRAWKQVLFNQFHDTLGGTAIEPAYVDARDQLGEAASIAARAHNVAIQSISRLIDLPVRPGVIPMVVFNPHPWPVRSTVELEYGGLRPTDGLADHRGRPIPVQEIQPYATVQPARPPIALEADVPGLGQRPYRGTGDTGPPSRTDPRTTPTR